MPRLSGSWLLGLSFAFALGVVLGAATVSRGTAGRSEAVLARLAEHLVIVDGCLHGVAGPHILVEGVNVHIRSGAESTDEGRLDDLDAVLTGLGNPILGYNRAPEGLFDGEQVGSHTLIMGDDHRYSSAGGLIAGFRNTVSGVAATVSGGAGNGASGRLASVSGGQADTASEQAASISGGESNTASGTSASVSGGSQRTATGEFDWVAGTQGEDF